MDSDQLSPIIPQADSAKQRVNESFCQVKTPPRPLIPPLRFWVIFGSHPTDWPKTPHIKKFRNTTNITTLQYISIPQNTAHYTNRLSHNPKVVGSNPASATNRNTVFRRKDGVFLFYLFVVFRPCFGFWVNFGPQPPKT